MVKKVSKKLLSILLVLCICFSTVSASAASVFAADKSAAASVKQNPFMTGIVNFGVTKIYTNGFLACGNALTRIAAATDSEGFQNFASFLNKWVFGGSQGQTLGEIKALCASILEEVKQIDAKLTSYTSELKKIMTEIKYNEAMRYVDEKWNSDVTDIENSNHVRNTLDTYMSCMETAQNYNDGKATQEDVEKKQEALFEDFCRMYSSVNGGFTDEENTYEKKREIIFSDSTIDDIFISTIKVMSSSLNNEVNYADVVAQFAYESFPFCTDQYEYIKVNIDKQFMEIIMLEMVYQEFLAQRGDFIEEKYPDDQARWDSYEKYLSGFSDLNETVANDMNTMLDRELKISPVNGIQMKLEEYPKADDATSLVMHNSKYQYKFYQWFSKFVEEDVIFDRVFTLTPSGVNSFCIMDGTQYDDVIEESKIPYNMHMTQLVQKQAQVYADVHAASGDYRNLARGQYGDGTNNNYGCIRNENEIAELFNTPAFALCDSTPANYLSDYLSYAGDYPVYFMTSKTGEKGSPPYTTYYVIFKAIDARAQQPNNEFAITDVDAEYIQSDRENYETAYSFVLSNRNSSFKQHTDVKTSGSGSANIFIEDGEGVTMNEKTVDAGAQMNICFSSGGTDTVLESLTLQRHNDASDKSKVTSETTLLTKDQIEMLEKDSFGNYVYEYNAPYSDATVCLNTQKGHKVYVEGTNCSNDLITLDSYENLFAPGDTVTFIADDSVQSVQLEYENKSIKMNLKKDIESGQIGSFEMPDCDVTLVFSKSSCAHEFDENGFCTECGDYQPAILNNGVYEISNAGQLYWFASLANGNKTHADFDAQNSDANAVLVRDIDINKGNSQSEMRTWIPIGSKSSPYTGSFDGQSHIISGVKISADTAYCGLFGYISNSSLSNFTVEGSIDTPSQNGGVNINNLYVGSAAGYSLDSTISNVTSNVQVNIDADSYAYVGGIAGYNEGGTVSDCSNSESLSCAAGKDSNLGGVVGFNVNNGCVKDCENSGTVSVQTSNGFGGGVGGIVGNNQPSMYLGDMCVVERCTNTGDISGKEYVGGIVGTSNSATQRNCANLGDVSGSVRVGGIVGNNTYSSVVENCYNIGSISADSSFGAIQGLNLSSTLENCYYIDTCGDFDEHSGTSKTAEQFKSGEVAYLLNKEVTDGSQVWYQNIDNGETPDDYPKFDGGTVYGAYRCNQTDMAYSNYPIGDEVLAHEFNDNGFCTVCGQYEPAELNSDGVYEITNAGQMFWFASLVNGDDTHADFDKQNSAANAVLTEDIDLENREWSPIYNFNGTFDGQNHTISNLSITKTSSSSGLFGSSSGTVKNFTVKGKISLSSDGSHIGGAVGYLNGGTVSGVTSYVDIENLGCELKHVGGVAGSVQNDVTLIDKCLYYGNITLTDSLDCIGGILGYTNGGARISNCANLGTVKSSSSGAYIGGILGYVNNSKPTLNNCYNYGTVSCGDNSRCGAVVGWARNFTPANISGNYYLDSSSSLAFGSESKSGASAEAKTAEQFKAGEVAYLLNKEVTDGTQVWYQNIDNGEIPDDYPKFDGGTVYYLSYKDAYSNTYSEKPADPDDFDKDEDGNLIIKTYDDLVLLSQLVRSEYDVYGSQNYILENNIIAPEDIEWTQGIGSVSENKPFNGTFNGNGYCIIGLNVNSEQYGGLFEIIGENGCVKDLLVFDCKFKVSSKTSGGIAAVNNGTIDHCISGVNFTSGTIHFKNISINASQLNSNIKGGLSGGIAGENSGQITGCRNAAVVTGSQCGGIAAVNTGKIYGCANNAKIGTTDTSVSGGLSGKNCGTIESSYNSGSLNCSDENAKGSVAGLNGWDGSDTPIVKNVFYITSNGLTSVGKNSKTQPDSTNTAKSKNSDMQTDGFVDELNAVCGDSVTWVHNSVINKGYPTIKCSFLNYIVKSAGNGITVSGNMHKDLNISYEACDADSDRYKALSSDLDKDKIISVYDVNLSDNDGNFIPAELWCQPEVKISVPVSSENVLFAGIDADGNASYYKPDSVKDGVAVFTVASPVSFALVEDTNAALSDSTPVQTGAAMFSAFALIMLFAAIFIITFRRRNNFE